MLALLVSRATSFRFLLLKLIGGALTVFSLWSFSVVTAVIAAPPADPHQRCSFQFFFFSRRGSALCFHPDPFSCSTWVVCTVRRQEERRLLRPLLLGRVPLRAVVRLMTCGRKRPADPPMETEKSSADGKR